MAAEESKLSLSIAIPTETAVKLEADDVKSLLDESKEGSVVIIDVRGADYAGGHITNSVNVPYEQFADHLDKLVGSYKDAKHVIFHCMYSEQRGPHCANSFLVRRKELFPEASPNSYVLLGGFQKWLATYHDDEAAMKALIAGYDEDAWIIDEFGRRVHKTLI